ncbi:hypothetical protein AVEN_125403-1 [Araneus ventricosus]|uniref:ATP-dependent DNA helicase n=1 Tax=Araneus ventricosus TaxID=182803 RepID=A0A4Y2LWM2_ARAVE|nr:hypothetical protein AVEN_125403-1 [Araneus ventricosus]
MAKNKRVSAVAVAMMGEGKMEYEGLQDSCQVVQTKERKRREIECVDGGLFFLDASGGTGKTFLFNVLSAQTQKDKKVAIAVASSGIAATLLDDGRTPHSVLQLPLNIAHEETPVCNITKNSERCRNVSAL